MILLAKLQNFINFQKGLCPNLLKLVMEGFTICILYPICKTKIQICCFATFIWQVLTELKVTGLETHRFVTANCFVKWLKLVSTKNGFCCKPNIGILTSCYVISPFISHFFAIFRFIR